MLIVGFDPSECEDYVEEWELHKQPSGYRAARSALVSAVVNKRVTANYVKAVEIRFFGDTTNPMPVELNYPDVSRTRIQGEDIRKLLIDRGLNEGFFSHQSCRKA